MTSMPLCLSPGWNQIQFNLADFVRRAYGTNYVETVRIQMHANVLLRRIFFSDRLYEEDEKPSEYRLFKSVKEPVKKVTAIRSKFPTGRSIPKEAPVARPVSPVTDNEDEDLKTPELIKVTEHTKERVSFQVDREQDEVANDLKLVENEPEDQKEVIGELEQEMPKQLEEEIVPPEDVVVQKEPSVISSVVF